MRLGVLKTGAPPSGLRPRFGDYPGMFRRLLGEDHDYSVFAVDEGELPPAPDACQAFLITGSARAAYEPLPWIAELKDFLNAAKGRAALVGVCFGHQVMAEAFGGRVVQSPKGWGIGEHEYRILSHEPWVDGAATTVRLPASHQDQVVELPPGAEVIAASDFSAMGALAYRDQPAISIQLHPEFEPAYARALIEGRRGVRFPDAQAEAAIASFGAPDDRRRVGGWINAFLEKTVLSPA